MALRKVFFIKDHDVEHRPVLTRDERPNTRVTCWTTPVPDEDVKVYRIPAERLDYFHERIYGLAKTCERLDADLPDYTWHGYEDVNLHSDYPRRRPTWTRRYLVSVAGVAPKLPGGWRFIATIDHTFSDVGNIVRQAPGTDSVLPEEFQTCEPTCDHCGLTRRRNETYVVEDDLNVLRRVGGSCVRDYLGHVNPAHIAQLASWLRDLDNCFDCEGYYGAGSFEERIDIEDFVAYTVAQIETGGFLSRGKARISGGAATADIVWQDALVRYGLRTPPRGSSPLPDVTQAHQERAADAIAWARALVPAGLNDYLSNLRVVALAAAIRAKEAGILASLVTAYERTLGQESRRQTVETLRSQSHLPYQVGDKLGRKLSAKDKRGGRTRFDAPTVRCIGSRSFESDWGTSTLLSFVVTEGPQQHAIIKWWRSGGDDGIRPGSTGTLVATVKKAETHPQYGAATIVSRAVFTPTARA